MANREAPQGVCPAIAQRLSATSRQTVIEDLSLRNQGATPVARLNVYAGHVSAGFTSASDGSRAVAGAQPQATVSEQPSLSVEELPGPRSTNTRAFNAGVHRYLCGLHDKFGDIFKVVHEGKQLVVVRDQLRVHQLLTSNSFGKTGGASSDLSTDKIDYVMNLIQPMLGTRTPFFNTHKLDREDRSTTTEDWDDFFHHPEGFLTLWESQASAFLDSLPTGDQDVQALCFKLFERLVMTIMAGDKVDQACEAAGSAFRLVFDYFVQRYTTGGASYSISPADEMAMDKLHAVAERCVKVVLSGEASRSPSLLWEMKRKDCSEEVIVATLVNCMVAAVETPASAMARTLQELAFNRGLQENMRHASGEHLANMTMEALRKFAPATLLMREALEDVDCGGVSMPKGTVCGICVPAVHKCPQHFSQPDLFTSDRSLSFDAQGMFLTFSTGPRGCKGKYFAVEMMQIALSQFTQRFQLMPIEEYTKQSDFPKFVEWAVDGIYLKLLPRRPT